MGEGGGRGGSAMVGKSGEKVKDYLVVDLEVGDSRSVCVGGGEGVSDMENYREEERGNIEVMQLL